MTLSEAEYANSGDNVLLQHIKCKRWEEATKLLETVKGQTMAQEADDFNNLPLHAAIGYKAPDNFLLRLLECYPLATRKHGTDDWLPLHIAGESSCFRLDSKCYT
mmetsp:Transcript_14195/g.16515  ORF Transcript_14195/g.16515 Transcript_14195/m.16515 type:complete len:105 (-) Transcript_14195:694-1008(-)